MIHPHTGEFVATQMQHASWDGFRFYDIIMPLFIFLAGCSLPFSIASRQAKGSTDRMLYMHMLRRVLILWVFGMMIQGRLLELNWERVVFYSNTLQAIAAGTLFSMVIFLNCNRKWQLIVTLSCIVLYTLLIHCIPVPGHGAGILTPEANFAHYIDNTILRTLNSPKYTWIVSTLGFTATAMFGVFAGDIIRTSSSKASTAATLFVIGIVLTLTGWAGSFVVPIIKPIWNETFTIFSGGLCFLILAIFYYLIDYLGWKRWATFFIVMGMNAIFIYMATHLVDFGNISKRFVMGFEQYKSVFPLMQALGKFAASYLLLLWLYKRNIFFKI